MNSTDAMQPLSQLIQDLPLGAYGAAAVGLIAGLALWLAGRRVIKPIFAIVGGVIGGMVGFFVLPLVAPADIAGWPTPNVGLAGGALLGLAVALALFRFTMAVSTGVVFGLVGVLAAATYLHFAPQPPPEGDAATRAAQSETLTQDQQFLENVPRESDPPTEVAADQTDAAEEPEPLPAELARRFIVRLFDEIVVPWWDKQPAYDKLVLSGGCFIGAAIGLLIGLMMPNKSAAVVTALAGSAVWLPNMTFLATSFAVPGHGVLASLGSTGWLITWLVVAAVGMSVQLMASRRRKEGAEDAGDEDDDD